MNDLRDPWAHLSPARPPDALRAHVLAAARRAASRPAPGLLEAIYRDRLLRLCAAGLAALVIVNGLVAKVGERQAPVAATASFAPDADVPGDAGLTAAEQLDTLAQELGPALPRSRG